MLATSPWFSAVGSWPNQLDDNPTIHDHDHYIESWRSTPGAVLEGSDNSYLNQQLWFGSSEPYISVGEEDQSPRVEDVAVVVKKRNHSESERDRRKKINSLYSSLRSLLPAPEQNKKLSIPATVSRVVKYIPELQNEVKTLVQKKEKLITSRSASLQEARQRKNEADQCSSLCSVSVSKLGDTEFIVQISTSKAHKRVSLSHVLSVLDENGLLVIDVSSFRTNAGLDLFTVHLSVDGMQQISCEWLRQQLLSLYKKC
ncbi:Transcription factor ORG2-like protein [Drosera capensis]